jgi:hypothetical protein
MRALCTDEILGFLDQSNISAKNISRLNELQMQPDKYLGQLATTVREIGSFLLNPASDHGVVHAIGQALDHGVINDYRAAIAASSSVNSWR